MAKVKIYTTPTCQYCRAAKEFFKENKIKYEEIDVSKDRKAVREMVKISGQLGVPVILIDNKVIVGFDRDELENALIKKSKSNKIKKSGNITMLAWFFISTNQ